MTSDPLVSSPLSSPVAGKSREDWVRQVPSVTQLTRRLRDHLEAGFTDVWVRGELFGWKVAASGHGYGTLKDAGACLRVVCFRQQLSRLPFKLEDGQEVLLRGKVTVYEARGDYQLVVEAAEPVGLGALQLAFEQLKRKLAAEGLFDAERKKPLPRLPRVVGIVTSPTGAAIRDMLHVLERRAPYVQIRLFPAVVQGASAPEEIVRAIGLASRWRSERNRPLDVLVVGRGGGSPEDLCAFNDERVARAVAYCPIPTISAVGHEIDFVITDFVADLRAPTPSAAAEVLAPDVAELRHRVDVQRTRLVRALGGALEQRRLHVAALAARLVDPRERLRRFRERGLALLRRLRQATERSLEMRRARLVAIAGRLDALSPLAVLNRGFGLVRTAEGRIVRSIAGLREGERLETRVADGTIIATVEVTRPEA
jgi:exodeoxyribonuclease VII large subunit